MSEWYGQDAEEYRLRQESRRNSQKYGETFRRLGPPKPCDRLLPVMNIYLSSRGLSFDLARFNTWYPCDRITDPETGRALDAHPRVVIPGSNASGFFFWQARYMGIDPQVKRYESEHGPRLDSLIMVWPTTSPTQAGVVEGPMDALALAEAGWLGVALLGNSVPPEVLYPLARRLQRLKMDATVFPDRDDIGFGTKVAVALQGYGVPTRSVPLMGTKDIAEMSLTERRKL